MKVRQRVTLIRGVERMRCNVVEIRGDYAYVAVPNPVPFHRRTGKPRRPHLGWSLALRHCDPQAGRGTTR